LTCAEPNLTSARKAQYHVSQPAAKRECGYATRAPEMLVEFAGLRRQGRGAKAQYAIRLGRILKLTRWRAH